MNAPTTPLTDTQKREQALEQEAALKRQEEVTGRSGAVPNTAKRSLLDASDVQRKFPDRHFRWINVGNSDRAQLRSAEGYVVLPESEGGRRVGNLAIAYIPRQLYERRIAEIKKRTEARLKSHRPEVEQMADAVAKELRDRHGIDLGTKGILIDE